MARMCLIAPPFRAADGEPIAVPPRGYGGIQWALAQLIDGLVAKGVPCTVLGAPAVGWPEELVESPGLLDEDEICGWVSRHQPPVVVDFANFSGLDERLPDEVPYCSTWQLTGPAPARNPIYVSFAQRRAAGGGDAPVIRLPVNPDRYEFFDGDEGYLLFLGRISAWKGAYEAALLAHLAGMPLVVAGPAWEPDYLATIESDFGGVVEFAGEVAGSERTRLLGRARALVALSQSVAGPWGTRWCEPGAAVVAEAAVSGTPVVGSDNGCLPEIVPEVGAVLEGGDPRAVDVPALLGGLPPPTGVHRRAIDLWHHEAIAAEYLEVFARLVAGERWG